jgi:hypothetical protein
MRAPCVLRTDDEAVVSDGGQVGFDPKGEVAIQIGFQSLDRIRKGPYAAIERTVRLTA